MMVITVISDLYAIAKKDEKENYFAYMFFFFFILIHAKLLLSLLLLLNCSVAFQCYFRFSVEFLDSKIA